MEKRLFILLIAILAIVTGAKAQKVDPIDTKPTLTLEMYSGQTLTKEQMAATGLIAQKAGLTVTGNKDKSVTFYRGKKELFTIGNSKNDLGKVVVPTDVTWAYNIKPMSLSKTDLQVLADAGITVKYAYIALNISVTINKTNFTDDTFRTYVSENFDKNINNKGRLTEAEANAVTEIDVRNKGIASLKGVEYFTKLTKLRCNNNQLTELDVSGCTALIGLNCAANQLTSLDVSGCTALTDLSCYNNQLTSLNVSGCTVLEVVYCNNNQLASLNVSGCPALKSFDCYKNRIRGAAMTALVESLPGDRTDAKLYVYLEPDDNLITPQQVAVATGKGWAVKKDDGSDWVDYAGERVSADANGDGEVTAADAEAIVDYILGRQAPDSWFDEESADVVDDGVVDIQDLTQLIKLLTEE